MLVVVVWVATLDYIMGWEGKSPLKSPAFWEKRCSLEPRNQQRVANSSNVQVNRKKVHNWCFFSFGSIYCIFTSWTFNHHSSREKYTLSWIPFLEPDDVMRVWLIYKKTDTFLYSTCHPVCSGWIIWYDLKIPPWRCTDVVFVWKVDVVCITHVTLYWTGPELILVCVKCTHDTSKAVINNMPYTCDTGLSTSLCSTKIQWYLNSRPYLPIDIGSCAVPWHEPRADNIAWLYYSGWTIDMKGAVNPCLIMSMNLPSFGRALFALIAASPI